MKIKWLVLLVLMLSFGVFGQESSMVTVDELSRVETLQPSSSQLVITRHATEVNSTLPAGEVSRIGRFNVVCGADISFTNLVLISNSERASSMVSNIILFIDGVQASSPFNLRRVFGVYQAEVPLNVVCGQNQVRTWDFMASVSSNPGGSIQVGIGNIKLAQNQQRIQVSPLPVYGGIHSIGELTVHAAGTNVRGYDGSVWLITNTGTRRRYTSTEAFQSYRFNNESSVVTMSYGDYNLPEGNIILPAEGRLYLSSTGTDSGQYFVMSGPTKHAFINNTMIGVMGFNTNNAISVDLQLATFGYTIVQSSERHPKGTLINANGMVFYTTEAGKIGIATVSAFNSWGWSFSDIVPATSGDLGLPIEDGLIQVRTPGQLTPR